MQTVGRLFLSYRVWISLTYRKVHRGIAAGTDQKHEPFLAKGLQNEYCQLYLAQLGTFIEINNGNIFTVYRQGTRR